MTAASRLGLRLDLPMPDTITPALARAVRDLEQQHTELRPARLAAIGIGGPATLESRATACRNLVVAAGAAGAAHGEDPQEVGEVRADGALDNDRAFGIRRVTPTSASVVLVGWFLTLGRFLDDLALYGTSLDPREQHQLERGVACCGTLIAGTDPGDLHIASKPWPSTGPEPDAERRWVIGHHLFMILAQGLGLAAAHVRHGADTDNTASLRIGLNALTTLLDGAAAAFHYTCDFAVSDYEEIIRPSLSPPVAPEGMSGLNWRDHVHLMATLAPLRGQLSPRGDDLDTTRLRLRAAYHRMYAAHIHVCQHFVGTQEPSLTRGSSNSAVTVLERLRRGRSSTHGLAY